MRTKLQFDPKLSNYITHPYVYWDGWFTEEELKAIESQCIAAGTERSKVVEENGKVTVSDIRPCNSKIHDITQDNSWFFTKTAALLEHINDQYYGYDLWGFDHFQYTEYIEGGDRYGYHLDMITGASVPQHLIAPRKLSMSLILSDPSEYKGGEFEFMASEVNLFQPEQKRGRVLIFPSYILHKVNPVIQGSRRSIVIWVTGPKFK
jgi:PKHD-type hydroxylase